VVVKPVSANIKSQSPVNNPLLHSPLWNRRNKRYASAGVVQGWDLLRPFWQHYLCTFLNILCIPGTNIPRFSHPFLCIPSSLLGALLPCQIQHQQRFVAIYPTSHSSNHGVFALRNCGFSLAFAIRDSAKLYICFGMLEHSYLGCKSGSKASDCIQRTGS
jgi:hypothetical protein